MASLDMSEIDEPIRDIIDAFGTMTCCFTLQSCWGHFLTSRSQDPLTLEPLAASPSVRTVEYRIAYLALCIENSDAGTELMEDLGRIVSLDPDYIQFGSAWWFWDRQINSYALQVEPIRHADQDSVTVPYEEALHVQGVRDKVFASVREILRYRKSSVLLRK
ncbi:MAG TPA: hypothetical protein PK350_06125 [Deltaproteobacteria bacterium]|nr:hypothetical protein [Deltaproteobacteria bacterium]